MHGTTREGLGRQSSVADTVAVPSFNRSTTTLLYFPKLLSPVYTSNLFPNCLAENMSDDGALLVIECV